MAKRVDIDDYNDRLCAIKTHVQDLPKEHYVVLEYLMRHLSRVAACSEDNKMEPSNIAIVFGYAHSRTRVLTQDPRC